MPGNIDKNKISLGKSSNQLNIGALKGGIKKSEIDKKYIPLFEAYDDGNNILTDNEIQKLKNDILTAANPKQNANKGASVFSEKEALKFLNSNEMLKDTDTGTLFGFLKFAESKSDEVITSQITEENSVKTVYRDGENEITEIINNTTGVT